MLRRLLATAACLTIVTLGCALSAAAQDLTFTILHTNDVHSRLQPINRFDVICSATEIAQRQCAGGAARLITRIRQIQQEVTAAGGHWLLLDAGDQFQGSLFYTAYHGEAEARMMNAIGYQVMAVGNHEFDDGPAALAQFLQWVHFPVISANVDTSREPRLAGLGGMQILEVAGRRIGVIGVTTEDANVTSSPGPTVSFRRSEDVLPPLIQRLHNDGVRTIILLSHLGVLRDREVATAVPGLTLIVGGHSHTLLSNRVQGAEGPYPVMVRGPGGANVPIVQAAAFGRYLGRLQVTVNADGVATAATGDVELLGPDVAEDPEIARQLAELAAPLEAVRARVVGEVGADVDQSKCRREECEMGDLVSDALLWRLRGQNVQIAISNGGGLRAGIGRGPVTFGAVLTVLPFQNTVATLRMKGSDIVASLENGVSQVEQGAGRFAQVAGLRYTWERARPAGSRIVAVEVRGADGAFAPIEANATYTVATNNFVRQGGDGYAVMRDHAIDPYDYGEPLEDAVAAYLHERTPLTVRVDGRIVTR
jgi:5'-nucleotidase